MPLNNESLFSSALGALKVAIDMHSSLCAFCAFLWLKIHE